MTGEHSGHDGGRPGSPIGDQLDRVLSGRTAELPISAPGGEGFFHLPIVSLSDRGRSVTNRPLLTEPSTDSEETRLK